MPMARTRRGRLRQVEAWLRQEFPPPLETVVRVESVKDAMGDCGLVGGRLVVRVHNRATWYHAIDLMLHEWAHACAWQREKQEHNRTWSDVYGRIYRAWYSGGGAEASRAL